jgi:uncharacterized protein YodC (DUF2158 family)
MTVTEVTGNQVKCDWFEKTNKCSGIFQQAAVKLVDDTMGPIHLKTGRH